jgi:mannose-6-phosphate isomerase-like protein (cupin superfamily)
MIVKLLKDHHLKESPTCGELREILTAADYSQANVAIALDIKPTKAHYHEKFDEIYFMLDGSISLKFYERATGRDWSQELVA